jgi:hypothetical protein
MSGRSASMDSVALTKQAITSTANCDVVFMISIVRCFILIKLVLVVGNIVLFSTWFYFAQFFYEHLQ